MAETTDNQPASLVQAATLLQQGVIEKIVIPDPRPPYDYGYPGPNYCKQILLGINIPDSQIQIIFPDKHLPHMNTQTELAMLAEYLKESGYRKNIVIIAPWFHILRSYVTALSEFTNHSLDINVFVSSVALDPYQKITHSQGIQKGTRRKIFYEKFTKCDEYKNLIPVRDALEIFKKQHGKVSG